MNRTFLVLSCVAAVLVLTEFAHGAEPKAPRVAPAVPKDLDAADRLAKCSAAYVTQYRILEAAGKKEDRLAKTSEWFYDAAAARSDVEHTKVRFTAHYKAYLALNETVAKAKPDGRVAAAKKFTETLNADFDACDLLRKKVEPSAR